MKVVLLLVAAVALVAAQSLTNIRAVTGAGNNVANPTWGEHETDLLFQEGVDYYYAEPGNDGTNLPTLERVSGNTLRSARDVSTRVFGSTTESASTTATNYHTFWGQFVDHDLGITDPPANNPSSIPIMVPSGDPIFDAGGTGTQELALTRAAFTLVGGRRSHPNDITAHIDASNVYGSSTSYLAALRLGSAGVGRLATSDNGRMPPLGVPAAQPIATGPMSTRANSYFVGDVRGNENLGLLSIHTLMMREHNWLADQIAAANPTATDAQVFEAARAWSYGEHQSILNNEFLPTLFGNTGVTWDTAYPNYDATVNAQATDVFTTCAYRVGHTLISDDQPRWTVGAAASTQVTPDLSLRMSFFNPTFSNQTGATAWNGVDTDQMLNGLWRNRRQNIDTLVTQNIRNFLFQADFDVGSSGQDLIARNIQRGRDFGLPTYAQLRFSVLNQNITQFSDISSDTTVQAALMSAYTSPADVECFPGMMAETTGSAQLGATLATILRTQFNNFRRGDRFWYQNANADGPGFTAEQITSISNTRLQHIIFRNTDIQNDLPNNVMSSITATTGSAANGGNPPTYNFVIPGLVDDSSDASTVAVSAAAVAAAAALL